MEVDRHGLEVLSDECCLALLRGQWLGRLAVSIGALPAILPVVYAVDGSSVVFRTVAGSKLEAIGHGQVVCFQVDDADRQTHRGWSVMIVGKAVEVTDPAERARFADLLPDAWPIDGADRFVRLSAQLVSGRRVAPVSVSL